MKEPKFGSNKEQSFIEFETTEGKLRFGKEDSRIFVEIGTTKSYLTDSDGSSQLGDVPTPVVRTNNPIVETNDVNPNIDALDAAIGADNVPVVRTNNPTVANSTINAKVQVLDTAIGTDAQLTAVARTAGPVSTAQNVNQNIDDLDAAIGADVTPAGARTAGAVTAAGTVNANIDALDAAIGFEAQMSGTPNLVTKSGTIFQMLDQIDAMKTSQTVKKTIGWDGAAGTDFVFAGDADHVAQNIDLGAIVPAKARVTGIEIVCIEAAVGVTDITFRAGNASAGEQFIASASCDDLNEVVGIIDSTKTAAVVMNWAAATNIFIGADPSDATWGDMTAGKWAVYVTFTYLNNI